MPYFSISPYPDTTSRAGSVRSARGSIATYTGCVTVPTRFFPLGRLTAVLPPIAASTAASSVVGTAPNGMPRWNVAAAKPTASEIVPPPTPPIDPRLHERLVQRRDGVEGLQRLVRDDRVRRHRESRRGIGGGDAVRERAHALVGDDQDPCAVRRRRALRKTVD